jgi:CubicO group peptidase (beta-lactamase class C family)
MTSDPLAGLAEWPCPTVAGAVVDRSGPIAVHGDLDRRFPLASVTKPLVASAVWVALEEEVLDLDQPAGPEGSTVRHLLAHASGLGLDGVEISRPGRRRIYSNTGFEVLGETLEAAAGIPTATYLHEAVLAPLGMTSTSLDGSPAHAATSTVADLARWVGEVLAPDLLAPETVALATSVAFPGLDGLVPGYGKQSPNDWGLGVEVRSHKSPHWTGSRNSPATFGHFGRAGTFVWVDPDAGVGLVVLTDRDFDTWAHERWPAVSDAVLAWAGRPPPA